MARAKTVGNLGGIEGIKVVCKDGSCWPRQYGEAVKRIQIGKRTIVAQPAGKRGVGKGLHDTVHKSMFGDAARACKGLGKGPAGFRTCMSETMAALKSATPSTYVKKVAAAKAKAKAKAKKAKAKKG